MRLRRASIRFSLSRHHTRDTFNSNYWTSSLSSGQNLRNLNNMGLEVSANSGDTSFIYLVAIPMAHSNLVHNVLTPQLELWLKPSCGRRALWGPHANKMSRPRQSQSRYGPLRHYHPGHTYSKREAFDAHRICHITILFHITISIRP